MRRNAVPTLLALCLPLAVLLLAPAASARTGDPAAVGGGYDPAFVDGDRPTPVATAAASDAPGSGEIPVPAAAEATEGIESLLKQVRTDMRSLDAADPRTLQRYRETADALARAQWSALAPRTRLRYADAFDRASPADARSGGANAIGGDIEDRGLARDPGGALRGLEAFLVPMLQDLQHAVDVKLTAPRIEH